MKARLICPVVLVVAAGAFCLTLLADPERTEAQPVVVTTESDNVRIGTNKVTKDELATFFAAVATTNKHHRIVINAWNWTGQPAVSVAQQCGLTNIEVNTPAK
jgi:hypothetical protein